MLCVELCTSRKKHDVVIILDRSKALEFSDFRILTQFLFALCKPPAQRPFITVLSMASSHIKYTGRHVWRSDNGVGHINEAKQRRVRLVLGLVTTYGGSTIAVFSRPLSLTQPGHLSAGRRVLPPRKKRRVLCMGPVTRTAGILAYCVLPWLGLTLAGSKIKGDELHRVGPLGQCTK